MVGLVVLASFNLILQRMPRQPSVRHHPLLYRHELMLWAAKFTGYQYGGRPLGLSYVKYLGANGSEAIEGTEQAGGLTQDQMM